jgi:hypothetical protein
MANAGHAQKRPYGPLLYLKLSTDAHMLEFGQMQQRILSFLLFFSGDLIESCLTWLNGNCHTILCWLSIEIHILSENTSFLSSINPL